MSLIHWPRFTFQSELHLLNNEPHNEGAAYCESSLFNNEGIGAHCWNNEPYNDQKSSFLGRYPPELIMSPPH